jgi:hypothetical protein
MTDIDLLSRRTFTIPAGHPECVDILVSYSLVEEL